MRYCLYSIPPESQLTYALNLIQHRPLVTSPCLASYDDHTIFTLDRPTVKLQIYCPFLINIKNSLYRAPSEYGYNNSRSGIIQ